MKWYAVKWFGGVKLECGECHRYTTEWTEQESRARLCKHAGKTCTTCQWEKALYDAIKDKEAAYASVNAWKDAWFHLRDLIGVMSWEHANCPHDQHSEPEPPPNWWLEREAEFARVQTRVYQRTNSNWKLIASGTSVEAAEAVIRLMKAGKGQ